MGGRFIITESEKYEIRKMYGLITEQIRCDFENYQNGDGVTKPKVDVSKTASEVKVTYNGPETGFCIQHKDGSKGDSIHQATAVAKKVTGDYLKELYNSGTYVIPDLDGITMTKDDNFLEIKIPLSATTEDKAITSFDGRGGWGHRGVAIPSAFQSDPSKYAFFKKNQNPIVAQGGKSSPIYETYFYYRQIVDTPILDKNGVQIGTTKGYPIQAGSSTNKNTNNQSGSGTINIQAQTVDELETKIKDQTRGKSLDLTSIKLDMEKKTFSVNLGNTPVYGLFLRFNLPGESSCQSCQNTISKNTEYGAVELKGGKFENNTRIYSLIVLYPKKQ
jgi:hypothetical protein